MMKSENIDGFGIKHTMLIAPIRNGTTKSVYQEIDNFLTRQDLRTHEKKELILGAAGDSLVKNAAENGIDIKGFVHSIDNFFVIHALNRHGNEQIEKNRGNVHITNEDIKNIPAVLQAPDFIIYGSKSKTGNKAILFVKNMAEATVFVEEVRNGRMKLAAQTLYKLPKTIDVSFLRNAPNLYAHSDLGTIKIVDVKNEIVKRQFFDEKIRTTNQHNETAKGRPTGEKLEKSVYERATVIVDGKRIECRNGLLAGFKDEHRMLEAEREKNRQLSEQVAELQRQAGISNRSNRYEDFEIDY